MDKITLSGFEGIGISEVGKGSRGWIIFYCPDWILGSVPISLDNVSITLQIAGVDGSAFSGDFFDAVASGIVGWLCQRAEVTYRVLEGYWNFAAKYSANN